MPRGARAVRRLCARGGADLARTRDDHLDLLPALGLDRELARLSAALGGAAARSGDARRCAERRAGELAVDVPQDVAGALACYDELVAHHQRRWQARGHAGAFADPWFDRFHRRLIERRFGTGEIMLMRVRAGAQTIGCLY